MNIFQKRHQILSGHLGERLTPAQLRTEFLNTFPEVNPASINPADCFWTPRKAAGCTCPECTSLGGFAVNRSGIVDMGASGWGGLSSAYIPGRSRKQRASDDASTFAGARFSDSVRIDPNRAADCIRRYNAASYRGCQNVALDEEAYRRFSTGLSRNFAELVDQIQFVGERYGAAQERFGSIRKEAELIAARLYPILERWLKVVMEAKRLSDHVPDEATLKFLFSPFVGTRQWPVWASKTLHFLRPDVFPILDSNAKKPLGLAGLVNSSVGYHEFCSVFRNVLLGNSDGLAAARIADGRASPTDLKLLDKVLYQIGASMK